MNAIDGDGTSGVAARATMDLIGTPAQHLNTVNSIIRESPFDPVLHPDGDMWVQQLQETAVNLNSAFAAVAKPSAQDLPRLPIQGEEVHEEADIEVSEDPSKHPSRDLGRNPRNALPPQRIAPDNELIFPKFDLHVTHIYGSSTTYSSKREYMKVEREVCSTSQGATAKMKWSQKLVLKQELSHHSLKLV